METTLKWIAASESHPGQKQTIEGYMVKHQHDPNAGMELEFIDMEGDHITPWRDGERTVIKNCQILCRDCNRRKGAK